MDYTAHQKALDKAKIALMREKNTTFFCDVVFSFKYEWDTTIPTAATDGVSVFINPDFWMELEQEHRTGLLLHEAMHPIYQHLTRKGQRDHQRWNIAGDHVINLVILGIGFKLPPNGYHDKQYSGMTTEQVYDLLPEGNQEDFDSDILPPKITEEELQERIDSIIVRAAIRSEQEKDAPGSIPGDIQLYLDKLLNPKLPWNQILSKYLRKFSKSGYTFKKPNRRFMPDYYLPSLKSQCLIDLVVFVDISGSVSDQEFLNFVSHTALIFKLAKPKKITVIQFDTELKSVDTVKSIQELVSIKFTGRGGTDIRPAIQWINENKPQVSLIFTDGEFNFKNAETKQDVLWLIHQNPKFKSPFGKVIHYEIQK